MAKLPLNLTKSLRAFKEASARAQEPASIMLAGDLELVGRAKEEFSKAGTVPGSTTLDALSGPTGLAAAGGDVVVVLTTVEKELQVRALLGAAKKKARLILAVNEGAGARNKAGYLNDGTVRLSFSDTEAGWERLFSLCAEVAGDKGVPLARRYPAVRRAAARRLVARTAIQNVFIALVFFLPGSDMPAMTLNQAKMILGLAAMYGQRVDMERAIELAGMVALGFGFRGIGRLLARAVPGLGTIMRAVTAYTATMAVGLGAIAYFEKGAPASTSKVIALAGSMRR